MKRGGPLKRKTNIRQVSPKRKALNRARSALVKDILERRPFCEAGTLIRDPRHRCWGASTDCHEKLTRARGGDILDESNILAICRSCHDWIHAHPAEAKSVGLLESAHNAPYTPEV
jgi:hypothetical protein